VFVGLGIRTGAQSHISLDLAGRPTKVPGAFVAAVRMPGDVRLSLRPGGGYEDYNALLGSGAQAQRAGFVSPEVRPEFRRAGDEAAGGAFALLFETLLLEPDWLGERFNLGRAARDLLAVAALARCFRARICAMRTIIEVEVHSGRRALAGAPEQFAESLSEATSVRESGADYLVGLGAGMHFADELRAWALSARLRDYGRTHFGRRWWSSRRAGELFKELWSTGGEYSAEELAAELGLGPLSFDLLGAELVTEVLQ
jgi:hypothetical protein